MTPTTTTAEMAEGLDRRGQRDGTGGGARSVGYFKVCAGYAQVRKTILFIIKFIISRYFDCCENILPEMIFPPRCQRAAVWDGGWTRATQNLYARGIDRRGDHPQHETSMSSVSQPLSAYIYYL